MPLSSRREPQSYTCRVPPSMRREPHRYTCRMLSVRAGRAGKVFSYTHAMKSDLSSSSDVGMSGSANHHVAGRPAVLDNVEATTEFTAKEYATSVHKSSEVSTVKECKESLHNSSEVQSTQVASSPPLRHTSQDLGCVSKLNSTGGQDMLAMDDHDAVANDRLVEKSTASLSCLLTDTHFSQFFRKSEKQFLPEFCQS